MSNARLAVLGVAVLLSVASVEVQAQRRAMSGDLTKALASYTGDEFFNLTQGLPLSADSTRGRLCRGPGCAGGGRVQVSVAEVTDADSVSARAVSQFGTIVLRALVRGNDTTIMYNMKPQGRYRYYLILQQNSRWILEELDIAGGRSHQTVATGAFNPCPGHSFRRGARADFRRCSDPQGDDTQAQALLRASQLLASSKRAMPSYSPLLAYLARQGGEPPIWIGCDVGCCTADQ